MQKYEKSEKSEKLGHHSQIMTQRLHWSRALALVSTVPHCPRRQSLCQWQQQDQNSEPVASGPTTSKHFPYLWQLPGCWGLVITHFDIDKEIKKPSQGTSLVVQWLRLHFQCRELGGTGSISGWETKILHVLWCGQKIKKQKLTIPS